MTTTEVYILGQKYTIKGDAPEEHIRELAGYIEAKIGEVISSSPNVSPLKAMILASFSMADDVFKMRAEEEAVASRMEAKTEALSILFEN